MGRTPLQCWLLFVALSNMCYYGHCQFCFSLCASKNECRGQSYDECKQCATGFMKKTNQGNNQNSYCVVNAYDKYADNNRYQVIGTSDDITYLLESGLTVTNLTISPGLNGNCGSYNFYGTFTDTSTVTVTYLGLSDTAYIHQVRLRYWIITIDNWDDDQKVKTSFTTDTVTTPDQTSSIDKGNNMQEENELCENNGKKERYRIIDHQFDWDDPSSTMTFEISVTGASSGEQWGIKDLVLMVKRCHPYCTVCTGDSNSQCSECNFDDQQAKLSGTTCALECDDRYGQITADPTLCVKCGSNCKTCRENATNCLTCDDNYYLYDNGTDVTCVNSCPSTYFKDDSQDPKTCSTCDSVCLECVDRADKCTSCPTNEYLYQNTCWATCPTGTWANNTTTIWKCANCNNKCIECEGSSINCSSCTLSGANEAYLKANSCLTDCGTGFYEFNNSALGPNVCNDCDLMCKQCDINATYCSSCHDTFYYFQDTCGTTCDEPTYFPDNATWTCLECAVYCVGLSTELYYKNSLKYELYYDLTFTEELSWNETDVDSFTNIEVDDPKIDISFFDVTYSVISTRKYRVTIKPKGYIFLYNATFTLSTISFNGTYHKAVNHYPFKDSTYDQSSTEVWFVIIAPGMSDTETEIVDNTASFSRQILDATTAPYFQEVKKSGVFAMLMPGAQATSMALLVDNIPSQNFYEGTRFWASFVFFDVPEWEANSDKTKYLVEPPVRDVIKDARVLSNSAQTPEARRLFDTSTIGWRFERTGHTSFFIFDTYMSIFLILLCWGLLVFGKCYFKNKNVYNSWMGRFFSFTHKVHEISILYISIATLLEWMYFDAASFERWLSMGFCLLFNAYFLVYEMYIYYDMINYPKAHIGNDHYDYYVLKYGSLLKNIRFEEYDPKEEWTWKQWFRPYNFHILSYYKKFLMLIALPIFYDTEHAQILVLMTLQLAEILRFLLVWPFKTRLRNIVRLTLDLLLLGFFATVLFQGYFVREIMKNEESTLSDSIDSFYLVGWVGFFLVFVFNIGHVALFIFDICRGCNQSNREMMDESRKEFYMVKLNSYEEENEDVPLGLVNRWVRLGNLNNRNYEDLPDVNLRVEYFKIVQNCGAYEIDIKKLSEIFMNVEFNFNQQNNLTAAKKINKRVILSKKQSPDFFLLIDELYNKYWNESFESLTLKTFHKVVQSNFKPGAKIPLSPEAMTQRIELETYAGQIQTIKLDSLLKGFPIDTKLLERIH